MVNKTGHIKKRFLRAIAVVLVLLTSTLFLSSCMSQSSGQSENTGKTNTQSKSSSSLSSFFAEYDSSNNEDSSWDSSTATNIKLEGDSIALDGNGAAVNGSTVTILSGGTYSISGTLNDGQIVVNSTDKKVVKLVLNGADLTCSTSAPINIIDAEKAVIILAEGTQNHITDGDTYALADSDSDEPDAAIFSKSDLVINNSGSLTVDANYKHGINSKDQLIITGGNITVNSVADGIRGKDCIAARDANITVNASGDGLKSNNDEDGDKGFVVIEGNKLNITSGEDAIQAETDLLISGGDISIISGGGSETVVHSAGPNDMRSNFNNSSDSSDSVSSKGIKAGGELDIYGGTINIDSADDSLHSNDSLTVNGGNITVSSGDDGIHADSTLEINDGDINITESYEGIESAVITINNGTIHIASSDDGINVAGGNNDSNMMGRPGQDTFDASGDQYLTISGGYIVVDARGDGIDVNGPINMTDGFVIVNGPTNDGNGALDYTGSFNISGGFIVAAGSPGMAQAPSESSTQYSLMVTFPSQLSAGTMFHVENEQGEEVLSFVPTIPYQNVVLCSPELEKGSTYNVYYGGSSTGTVQDGIYSNGTYTAGTKNTSFTISDMVTTLGSYSKGGMGGGMPGSRPNRRIAP